MKLLMFYAPEFWHKPFQKTLPEAPEAEPSGATTQMAVVVFYHGEAEDHERRDSVLSKMLKNIKWLCGKFNTRQVVLHSFGHLSESKAEPEFVRELVAEVRRRLENTDYSVNETPFGYLNEWKIHVAGDSLAKVFKSI